MAITVPTISGVLSALSTADWSTTIPYTVDKQPRPSLLDAATTVTGALSAVVDGQRYKIDITDIDIDRTTAEVTHRVPVSAWDGQPLTVYDFSFTEHRSDGVIETLVAGKLKLEAGPEA